MRRATADAVVWASAGAVARGIRRHGGGSCPRPVRRTGKAAAFREVGDGVRMDGGQGTGRSRGERGLSVAHGGGLGGSRPRRTGLRGAPDGRD